MNSASERVSPTRATLHADPRCAPLRWTRTGSGVPVLFVHGFPLDQSMWWPAIDALGPGFDCITPDLRGFGHSESRVGEALTMEGHADDLARLLDALDLEAVHVVALSMGGYVGLAFAERHRERLASLTLADTRAEDDGDEGRARRDLAAERVLEVGRATFAREMLAKLVAPGASRRVRAGLLEVIEATPYETILAALEGMKRRPDRTAVLRALASPVLVVCGAEDRLTPPELSRAMVAAQPGARLALLADAGHMAPLEQPAAFADVLRAFLRDVTEAS